MKNVFQEVFVLKECTLGKAKHIIQSKCAVRRGLATGTLPVFLSTAQNIDMGLDDL